MTDEQAQDEEEQFYRLARYLLTTYRGSGKTFVLQHWEGDWAIRGNFDRKTDPSPQAIAGMIRWLSTRQKGVEQTIRGAAKTAVDWGCPWVVYWQVYCNEPRRQPVRSNNDVRGFWLIRPDGTKAWGWEELAGLLRR